MKKLVLFLVSLSIVGCSGVTTKTSKPESQDAQMKRLIKLSDKLEDSKKVNTTESVEVDEIVPVEEVDAEYEIIE